MSEWDERMAEMEAEDALQEEGMLAGDACEEVMLDLMWGAGEDCPRDGDAESALASCGWGTDEDYGCFEADPYEY
jgi:hypothetical protein